MLEKLLGVGSFGGSIGHLTYHHAIFLISSNKLNLLFMVQITAPTFLRCWALIVPTLIICLQQDDCHILLDVITHVETNTSLFQIALQDVQAMLP
jgi:hypothetical protein